MATSVKRTTAKKTHGHKSLSQQKREAERKHRQNSIKSQQLFPITEPKVDSKHGAGKYDDAKGSLDSNSSTLNNSADSTTVATTTIMASVVKAYEDGSR